MRIPRPKQCNWYNGRYAGRSHHVLLSSHVLRSSVDLDYWGWWVTDPRTRKIRTLPRPRSGKSKPTIPLFHAVSLLSPVKRYPSITNKLAVRQVLNLILIKHLWNPAKVVVYHQSE